MKIGTVRAEEAKVFDSDAGYHQFPTGGSFEVFWTDGEPEEWDEAEFSLEAGWYWWPCMPGCLPDGEAHGPFANSYQAKEDAQDV